MATDILMPALSPTMTEGKLARWLKKEGDTISSGDVIAEIETDKATMEVEAVEEGVLGRILVNAGTEGVAVNTPIAILVEEGEEVPSASSAASPAPVAKAPTPEPKPTASSAPAAQPAPTPVPAKTEGARVFTSPLARRVAKDAGIDLSLVKGTGPGGRIVRKDVENARKAPPARPAESDTATGTVNTLPLSSMRKVIARRLTESKTTVPHFYVSVDVELDALLSLRAQLNATSPSEGPDAFKLSVNDMLIKAAALTLKQVPMLNVSFTDDAILQYEDIDISIAVSIPDGLITPIIRNADRKSLRQISESAKDLVARARSGKLKPEEFQGGTFSISNMGMYGVSSFSAILNPPQAGILAIAAGEKRPVVRGDALGIATVMTVTLSVDHRAVDGALAAEWASKFRKIVESPLSLVL